MERMDAAKAACAELAGLIWSEQCEVHVSQGEGEEQPLEEFVLDVLTKNNFWQKMQELIEQALALGGAAIKVWYEERRNSAGMSCGQRPDQAGILHGRPVRAYRMGRRKSHRGRFYQPPGNGRLLLYPP